MAVSTVDEYLSALEKSKLLASEQLVEAQRLAGESSDAAELARALARDNLVSRWQAGTLLALGKRAQLRLGKYKLIQRLGKGGMGTVFLAEHVTMNRRVALKIVPRSIAENRASLDRFFAEARAIAALDHPNIVQAYSVDNEMDRYFIVMEFVDGQDLQRIVEQSGPLDFERAADYIRQAAEGLVHAHARNLVHCDIKPSNLLVNNQGVVKILDLGLARLNRSDEPRGAAAGEPAFGTVDYMAPEQAMETANFDHRADIYSLGCTFYFLLTGHPPFPEGTLAQRIVKHQTQEPRDILLDRPDVPPKLLEICKRMMAKEPENRYQSIQEVSTALASCQNGVADATDGRTPRPVKVIEDAGGGEDLLSFLATPSTSSSASNGAKKPASATAAPKSSKSGKRQMKKNRSGGGISASLAGILAFGKARLGWFNTTKRKILGVGGGIVVLVVAAGLASLPFLLSHPKPAPQVAVQTKQEQTKTPVEEEASSPQEKPNEKKPETAKETEDKTTPGEKTDTAKESKPLVDNHPKITPTKPTEPDKAPPKPEVKTVVKTDVPPEKKPDPQPAPNPNVKPAEPEKKPEPPAKPAEAAKPVSLDGLAAAVDLPPLGKAATQAVTLGKLDLDPKLTVDIQLLGGDLVAKGNPKFELQKDGDGASPGWSIQIAEKGKDAVKIARVWQEDREWKIQWAAEAKDKATLVRYCGLQFTCGKTTRLMALSTPKTVPPLLIDVDAGGSRAKLSKDGSLPDVSLLRLQVLPLDKSMPESETKIVDTKGHAGRPARGKAAELVPGDKVPVKGHVIVVLKKEKTPRVAFDIAFDARGKDVFLEMQGACDLSGRKVPLNLPSLQRFSAEVNAFLMANDQGKGRKPPAEQVQMYKMAKDDLKALSDLVTELNQKASIPFRVYALLGETDGEKAPKVVIFQSGEVESPKASGNKKNPKNNKVKGRGMPELEELKLK